jgi:hypothetical protein
MNIRLVPLSFLLLASTWACGDTEEPYAGGNTVNEPLPEAADMNAESADMNMETPTSPFVNVIVVNELMSSNDTAHADDNGEFDDWIELYNASADPINLGGWRISDEEDYDGAFEFTDEVVIEGNGYLLVWADNDTDQGPVHTSFKLSGDGEAVVIYDADGALVQLLEFGEIATDTSYGRHSDESYDNLETFTPGMPNE